MNSSSHKDRPDFAVIGAMRAGTTQIYEMLRNVPGICVPHMKETDFFCSQKSMARGHSWYARQFDDAASLWGDISPNYSKTDINPEAAELLHQANPAMKIFFIARDPVERAISHYKMVYYIEDNLPAPENLLHTWSGRHILHTSSYYACLLPFWEKFGDGITILDFSMLVNQPSDVIDTICEALHIRSLPIPADIAPQNSFDELARTPGWWSKLRRSELGTTLRATLPRPVLNFAKAQLALKEPKAPPPPFPDSIRKQISELLSSDVEMFRRRAGMGFEDWSI